MKKTWIIVDLTTGKALYGRWGKTMAFTTQEIAYEVAEAFSGKKEGKNKKSIYLTVQVNF